MMILRIKRFSDTSKALRSASIMVMIYNDLQLSLKYINESISRSIVLRWPIHNQLKDSILIKYIEGLTSGRNKASMIYKVSGC
jgi:hypothetical protein